ncbi:Riboflavin synthase-like beta-barrel [Penicillium expansum]|nr:Riboflavin synthase-like beta-barrel [Penicillium expansum]
MSGLRPFPRKTAVAIAVVGVVGLCAARRASLRNEAFAESPKACGGPEGHRGRGGPGGPGFGPGGRMGFHTLRLESFEQVNDNTKRLRFQLPDPASNAGLSLASFILTFHKPKDAWFPVIRPYTPINNFDEPGYIELLVKKYPNGRASGYLHSLQPGDTLNIRGPMPGYRLKTNEFEHVNLIAGGAGITPMYQLIQGMLNNPDDKSKIKLIFGVNTDKDLVMKRELDAFENKFSDRLKVVYRVSDPVEDSPFTKGRVDKELLEAELLGPKDSKTTKVFLCGPPAMEASIFGSKGWTYSQKGVLEELGYSKDRIHKF